MTVRTSQPPPPFWLAIIMGMTASTLLMIGIELTK